MPKVWKAMNQDGSKEYHGFECPGCGLIHMLPTTGPGAWGFNQNLEKPTFTPSILALGFLPPTDEECARIMAGEQVPSTPFICHSFVTDGRIRFEYDSSHSLAGQIVDLKEIE